MPLRIHVSSRVNRPQRQSTRRTSATRLQLTFLHARTVTSPKTVDGSPPERAGIAMEIKLCLFGEPRCAKGPHKVQGYIEQKIRYWPGEPIVPAWGLLLATENDHDPRGVLVGRTGEYLSKRASSPTGKPSRSPTHGALGRYGA